MGIKYILQDPDPSDDDDGDGKKKEKTGGGGGENPSTSKRKDSTSTTKKDESTMSKTKANQTSPKSMFFIGIELNLIISFLLSQHFLHGNVPLRHLLNAKPRFILKPNNHN